MVHPIRRRVPLTSLATPDTYNGADPLADYRSTDDSPLLGTPATPQRETDQERIDAALALIALDEGVKPVFFPTGSDGRQEGYITVCPLPARNGGRSALVVYPNGGTVRYDNLTILSTGRTVAQLRGHIVELFPLRS